MTKKIILLTLFFLLIFDFSKAQSIEILRQKINQVLADKSATVGVAIRGMHPRDTLAINGNKHLPMHSVFKFHLALAVLYQVDQGNLSLNQKVSIEKELIDTYRNFYSPIRKKYPNGTKLTLAELIEYTVALSDNLGCDVLFDLIGGTKVAESYIHKLGIKDIAIVHPELIMQAEWKNQYDNWTTANAANQTLELFFKNEGDLLSKKSYNFLLNVLKGTKTGEKSIRGLLPKDAVIAHKTGYSGKNDQGLIGGLNDIGIVFLPDNSFFYLSILVSNSVEGYENSQKIIAEIAKLTWDYFKKK